jgi:lipopolysaccharide export system protein LptC
VNVPRWLPATLLALAALASSWLVYRLNRGDQAPVLMGPPRSDYTLQAFSLVALDAQGREAFSVEGPRLARHPHLGTLDIAAPRLRFPDASGEVWTTRADSAFVTAEADRVRLSGDVLLEGPPAEGGTPPRLATRQLDLFPADNRIASAVEVTLTGPGSILRGRGLAADLDTRRFELDQPEGRFETRR